jgi:hypothetical protein
LQRHRKAVQIRQETNLTVRQSQSYEQVHELDVGSCDGQMEYELESLAALDLLTA